MGIYLSSPKTDKFSEDGENDKLRYGLSSMQGWRATMEDAVSETRSKVETFYFVSLLIESNGFNFNSMLQFLIWMITLPSWVSMMAMEVNISLSCWQTHRSFFMYMESQMVFTSVVGKVVSKFCAKYLHQQVLCNEAYAAGDVGTSLQQAFFRMDEMMQGQRGWRELAILGDKINKFSGMIEGFIWSPRSGDSTNKPDAWAFEEGPHSDFPGPNSGSTACVAVIRHKQLVVANAGDSRCVISRKGQAYNLSRDHKPDLEAEKERILKAGGFIHAGRVNGSLNLARAIGDMEFKQNKFLPTEKQIVTASPDINTVELCDDDDFLVLACDGIWDCMSSQQLVDFIHEKMNTETKLSVVCEKVLDRCLAPNTSGGEGCDNMTLILVQFKKPVQSTELTPSETEAKPSQAKGSHNEPSSSN